MSQSHSCNVLTGAEFSESVKYIMGSLNSKENDSCFSAEISSLIASSKQRVMNVFPFSTNDSECIEVSCDTFEILELLFKAILLRITSTQKNKCQVETNILQNAVEIIETLTNLLDETVKCNQVKNVNLLSKKNIAGSTLHVIHGSYVHCQSSETTYGDNFPSVAALLGDLFRKTFRLQKALTTILGKANVLETCNPEACEGLLVVCSRLLEICHVVADMDCALMGMSWKLLSSFMCKYQQFLSMRVSLDPYILELLEKISKFLQQATDEFSTVANETRGDNDFASVMKKVASSLRMASFLMGFLSTLLSQYFSNFDGGHCSYLTDFVFSAVKILQFRFILKSSDASTLPIHIQKLIFSHFQPEFDKLLLLLSSSAQFQHRLKNSGSDEAFVELYILLRLSVVLGTSHSDSTVWFGMSDNTSIVSLLFNLLPSFYCQLNQRYCMYTGDQESLLYEVILTHLCGCLFAAPQSSFGHLETVLLQNLTSVNPYQSSLAADLWCILARLSPASLCYHYVQLLSLVVASFPPNTVVTTRQRRVCWLLGRLFKFLTPNQQIALLDLYPITEDKNLAVVASFGSHLTCCSFQRITSFLEIVTTALKDFLEADGVASQVNRIESYLCILCSIFDGFKYDQGKGNILNQKNSEYKEVCSCLSGSVVCLWKFLNCNCSLQRTLVTFSSQLCRLTSFLWEYTSKEDTEIILRKVKEVTNASLETREELCYSIALLLTGLRHVHLNQTALGDLIFLWKLILSQAEVSWLLRHNILDAFELFSKVTKHPELVAMVCADNGLNTGDCDVMSLIKSHLMREITPLPENVSIETLLKHHQGALKSSVYVSEIINSVSESTELHDVIGDITNNLNTLKRISKEALDLKTRTLLKELLTTVENLLPCKDL